MPPEPWKPIVSAGATGTAGGASGAWLKLNAENRLFCRALSGVSAGRSHSFCMNDRIETLVLCWWYTPWRAYGLMMIIGVPGSRLLYTQRWLLPRACVACPAGCVGASTGSEMGAGAGGRGGGGVGCGDVVGWGGGGAGAGPWARRPRRAPRAGTLPPSRPGGVRRPPRAVWSASRDPLCRRPDGASCFAARVSPYFAVITQPGGSAVDLAPMLPPC